MHFLQTGNITVTDGGVSMAGRVDFMFSHPRSMVASWQKKWENLVPP